MGDHPLPAFIRGPLNTPKRCLGVHKTPIPNVRRPAHLGDSILVPAQDAHPEYKIDFTVACLWRGREYLLFGSLAAPENSNAMVGG
jgi:hypothetical protein